MSVPPASESSPAAAAVAESWWDDTHDTWSNQTIVVEGEPTLPLVRHSYPVLAQAIVGFAFGMMLSPWSVGIEFVIAFMLVWETMIFAITEGKAPYWKTSDRLFVVAAYLSGWILGRYLAGWRDPFMDSNFESDWLTETPASRPGQTGGSIVGGSGPSAGPSLANLPAASFSQNR